jgi:hypothetical protein
VNVGEIAKDWYEKHEPEGALAGTLLRCFFGGTIIRRPNYLLMGETCRTDGKTLLEGTPHNAWFIHFYATEKGTFSPYELCLEAPYQLEWVIYKRRGRLRFIPWQRLYWMDFKTQPRAGVPC